MLDLETMPVRRCVFWILLTVAIVASLVLQFPSLHYITIRGKVFGGNAYAHAVITASFALLLLWSAVYVRLEPLLVRITLVIIAVPFFWESARDVWSIITFTAGSWRTH